MSSPWRINATVVDSMANIISEEYAHRIQNEELKKYENIIREAEASKSFVEASSNAESSNDTLPQDILQHGAESAVAAASTSGCDSDEVIAYMLQSQFDREYNEELRRIEQKQNRGSKVTVTLDKFMRGDKLLGSDEEEVEEEDTRRKPDWDRFERTERILGAIPKCGFKVDSEGEIITKHDPELCNVRNACRVMSFPSEFPTGDGAGFEMKLSNKVYNQLKTYSRSGAYVTGSNKRNHMHDRKVDASTAEIGVDAPTRLLLYKLINNQILEQINGIISTGKEAVILHANSDPAYTGHLAGGTKLVLPKECAVKIFKASLKFKQRERYIKDDYRFKARFNSQKSHVLMSMWAEKEMLNLKRIQSVGLCCPEVVVLKKHILVMSFIGNDHNAAPKLKDVQFGIKDLSAAYEEIVVIMHKLYNEAKLVHADLSEYNILWFEGKCWLIDVAQAVGPQHPSALEFLMRDCANVINFFRKRGLPNIYSKEQLFEHVTALNAETHNAAMLERIHTRGATIIQATAPEQDDCPDELRPLEYPFELAWEKSLAKRKQSKKGTVTEIAAIDRAIK